MPRSPKAAPALPRDPARPPAWAETFVRWFDDGLTIPGTRIGIGLDALLGFVFPTLGDAATGLGSLSLLLLAFQLRVPKVVILRVVLDIGIDAVLGSVPLIGDVFDVFWRSNRRNLERILRYAREPSRRPDVGDYLLVGASALVIVLAVVLPLVVGFALLRLVWRKIFVNYSVSRARAERFAMLGRRDAARE